MNTIVGIFLTVHLSCETIDELDRNIQSIIDKIDQENLLAIRVIHLTVISWQMINP